MEEEETLRLMSKLASHYPVCYANGNHESQLEYYPEYFDDRYSRYVKHLKEEGVHFLDNEWTDLDLKGLPVRVYGLTLPWKFYRRFCYRKFTVEGMKACLGEGTKARYQILLAHNPMSFPAYAGWGADLTLSGHLHGGFLRLPIVGGIISPQCVPFPKYDRGLFEENGHYLAVSAGLGTHDKLPRIGNPPELVVIDLQNDKGR
jgi:predicted MPP superfamily phosphohydrolase